MDPILIFILIALFAAIGALVVYTLHKQRQREREASEKLGVEELRSGVKHESNLDGVAFSYEYYAGSKNSPSYFLVEIPCASAGEFKIGHENWLDKIARRVGFSSEVQTQDPEFDESFYIHTNSVAFAAAYFSDPAKREAVRELFSQRASELHHDGESMRVKWTPFSLSDDPSRAFVPQAVRSLAALAKHPPSEISEPLVMGVPNWKMTRNLVIGAAGVLAAAGCILVLWGGARYPVLDPWDFFLFTLKWSGPAFVIFSAVAAMLLKGRSSSHYEFLTAAGIAVVALPLFGFGSGGVLNGRLDDEAARYHETPVVHKYTTRSKNSTTYYCVVGSWRRVGGTERFTVPSSFYGEIASGRTMLLVATRPGRFGFEWQEGYRILRNSRPD